MSSDLDSIRSSAIAHLAAFRVAPPGRRTDELMAFSRDVIAIRRHFENAAGEPDLTGRSYAYRQFIGEVYRDAGVQKRELAAVQSAVRYHVSNLLAEELNPHQREAYGIVGPTAKERTNARRTSREAAWRALEGEATTDASLALLSAARLLSRVSPEAVAELPDTERAFLLPRVESSLSALRALKKALA